MHVNFSVQSLQLACVLYMSAYDTRAFMVPPERSWLLFCWLLATDRKLCCVPVEDAVKIQIHLSATQLERNIYHFNYTNYYLFNANCTSFNKIHSLVFGIWKFKNF